MGYGTYTLRNGRDAGYLITAVCDQPDCHTKIDRGLGYLCGDYPDSQEDGIGCGNYYCTDHTYTHGCAANEVD